MMEKDGKYTVISVQGYADENLTYEVN